MFYTKEYSLAPKPKSFVQMNQTYGTLPQKYVIAGDNKEFNLTQNFTGNNSEFSNVDSSIKATVFGVAKNEILIRLVNLDDHFDNTELHKNLSQTVFFDVNSYARQLFLEANQHLIKSQKDQESYLSSLKVNVTEMNIGGSISVQDLKALNLTKWKVDAAQDPPKHVKPVDREYERKIIPPSLLQNVDNGKVVIDPKKVEIEKAMLVGLEPQRIRVFKVQYLPSE